MFPSSFDLLKLGKTPKHIHNTYKRIATSTSYQHNQGAAGAFSGSTRESAVEGNTSAAGTAGGQFSGPTTAQTEGITLGNDFSLRGLKGEREGDLVEPNVVSGETAGTAGPGGDFKHTGLQEHEKKCLKQRLENNDERADREARGYDEPINEARKPPVA
ncbi:hypothetical protein JCM11641_007398 [Rhodosporidiobolus odoratus]